MKRAKRTLAILTLALAGCQGSIVPAEPTPTLSTIRLLVEPSTATLWQNLAAAYRPSHTIIAWQIDTLDWDTISIRLGKGRAPFAMTSYLPTDSSLWATPIGYDALALIVNAANPVKTLSPAQLRALFSGQVIDWHDLGGAVLPVLPISRPAGSSDGALFHDRVLGDLPVTGAARLALSAGQVIDTVRSTPGALGYVPLSALTGSAPPAGVRIVPIDNVLPNAENITSGRYGLRSTVVFCGDQAPGDDQYRAFFAWVQSPAGQAIVAARIAPLQPLPITSP